MRIRIRSSRGVGAPGPVVICDICGRIYDPDLGSISEKCSQENHESLDLFVADGW